MGVPDVCPGSRYWLDSYARLRTLTARLAVEDGLGDRVAWEAQFDAVFSFETMASTFWRKARKRARKPRRKRGEDAP